MSACVHYVAECLVPELGWIAIPGEYSHPDFADSAAFRFALKWGGSDTRVSALECDGSCKQESGDD